MSTGSSCRNATFPAALLPGSVPVVFSACFMQSRCGAESRKEIELFVRSWKRIGRDKERNATILDQSVHF